MFDDRRTQSLRSLSKIELLSLGLVLASMSCLSTPNQAEPDDIRGLGPGVAGSGGSMDASVRGGVPGTAGGGGGSGGGGPGPSSPADGPPDPTPGADGPEPPAASCGNGQVDPGETCDPPSDCPRVCPEVTCTVQRLVGSPESCNVRCEEDKITTCTNGDRCCPRGANPSCTAVNDAECSAICDNGAIEAGETCDPKATCQTRADTCKDDKDTLRTITGDVSTCTIACTERKRPCQAGDGQCPTGCTAGTDADCGGCGNGRIEAGETCDPPSSCQRTADTCRDDAQTLRTGSGDVNRCTFACMERKRPCQAGDGECPSGCAPSADTDCPGCGNRRVEGDETCDPCANTACSSDRNTVRTPTGSAGTCTFRCVEMGRACGPSDRECPNACPPGQDPDCRKARSEPCNNANECIDGNCADGVCCNAACNDGCRSCRVGGRVGTCSAPNNNEVCGDGPTGGNGRDDNCNGQVDEGCCGNRNQLCCAQRRCNNSGLECALSGNPPRERCICGIFAYPCCAPNNSCESPSECVGGRCVCGEPGTRCCSEDALGCNNGAACMNGRCP
jgi:hypothetical protein